MLEKNIIRGEKVESMLIKSLGELIIAVLKVYQDHTLLVINTLLVFLINSKPLYSDQCRNRRRAFRDIITK